MSSFEFLEPSFWEGKYLLAWWRQKWPEFPWFGERWGGARRAWRSGQCLLLLVGTLRGSLNNFPDFFRMVTFIDSTHMKLQCTYCTVPTTSGRPHGSPLV